MLYVVASPAVSIFATISAAEELAKKSSGGKKKRVTFMAEPEVSTFDAGSTNVSRPAASLSEVSFAF